MSRVLIGNIYLVLSLLCVAVSHVLLKSMVNDTGPLALPSLPALLSSPRVGRLVVCAALLVVSFALYTLSLGDLDVSYAYAVACSSALLVALLSAVFLGERLSAQAWSGVALIVVGSVLLMFGQRR